MVQDAHAKGFSAGYKTGYETGAYEAQNGVCHSNKDSKLFSLPIEHMSLSVSAYNCLIWVNCKKIGEVARLGDEQIRTMPQLGKKTADEIARKLKELGIQYTGWDKCILP